ncbi:MAG: alpha/beta hydrolase [Candidatus Acidiferrales bacterium]
MRRTLLVFATLLAASLLSGAAGWLMGPGVVHPLRRPLTPELIRQADEAFRTLGATREDFEVRAADGVVLRGWQVRPRSPNGDWVLLFHGVSDNRVGMLGHAGLLLRNGYGVVMMDARAHGASDGEIATYGWKEREDTRAIVAALYAAESVHCLFALGESMGGAIALQSAAEEPRVAGVVAESAFSDLREVSYDYAGLSVTPWLGRTLFRPAVWTGIPRAEREGDFRADEVSPEKAVAARAFPVLLICGTADRAIPPQHSQRLYQAATGPKELWLVPGAEHSAALGEAPEEFERRVVSFLRAIHSARELSAR